MYHKSVWCACVTCWVDTLYCHFKVKALRKKLSLVKDSSAQKETHIDTMYSVNEKYRDRYHKKEKKKHVCLLSNESESATKTFAIECK